MLSILLASAFFIEQPCFATRVEAIAYPRLALFARLPGQIAVQIEINNEGIPIKLKPISGHELLLKAALPILEKWRFHEGCKKPLGTIEIVGHFRFSSETSNSPKETFVFEHPNRFTVTSDMIGIQGAH